VLLKLEGSGVCASSLPLWEGREWFDYPQPAGAPGHEGWGRVAAVGEGVEGLAVGDRVAALTYRAHAEYDVADAGAVVPLPASLAEVAMPGEPLGCAVNIFRRSDIRAGQTVAIVGIGFLGACSRGLPRGRARGSSPFRAGPSRWKWRAQPAPSTPW
jgi:threonine dehydrogenase-like Zn-dependent dehydrogenase